MPGMNCGRACLCDQVPDQRSGVVWETDRGAYGEQEAEETKDRILFGICVSGIIALWSIYDRSPGRYNWIFADGLGRDQRELRVERVKELCQAVYKGHGFCGEYEGKLCVCCGIHGSG